MNVLQQTGASHSRHNLPPDMFRCYRRRELAQLRGESVKFTGHSAERDDVMNPWKLWREHRTAEAVRPAQERIFRKFSQLRHGDES